MLACEDDTEPIIYDYHAHIAQPSSADKTMGDVLFIQVEFESHTGEAVEHINIRIRDKANTVIVYDEPADAHIDGDFADFEYSDQFMLTAANGISPGEWVLEATVWGMDEGQDQVTETVEFTVNP